MAQYRVTLTQEEINELTTISKLGRGSARSVLYARALLLLDKGEFNNNEREWLEKDVAAALGLTTRTLQHLKERFVTEGLSGALERKKPIRPSRKVLYDGAFAAQLTRLACSEAPTGRARWTVRLLAEKLIELQIVPYVTHTTVHNILKKTKFSLTAASTGKSRRTKTPCL
jgi:transposase